MKKLSKKATFEMLKNGAIKSDNLALQIKWESILNVCNSLNELKSEMQELKSEFNCYKSQIDNNHNNLWYLGQRIANNDYAKVKVNHTLEALESLAKVLGYKFDRHFLISIK